MPVAASCQLTSITGVCHLSMLQPSKAAAAFTISVQIQEAIAADSSSSSSSIIASLIHLGNSHLAAGDANLAADTLSRCTALAAASLGDGHILAG
jgi:hypothetical protein